MPAPAPSGVAVTVDEDEGPVALERQLMGRLDEFGITRMADTSGLDRLAIPTHSCVRPTDLDHIWVYSGKGTSCAQSRVSAVLEAVERTSALWDAARVVRGRAAALGPVLTPELFSEWFPGYQPDKEMALVQARRVGDDEPVLVPADLAFAGRRPPIAGPRDAARGNSNGLACSTALDDALTRALLEVIERDAVSFADLRASALAASFLSSLRRLLGLPEEGGDGPGVHDDPSVAQTIGLASLPPLVAALVERFHAVGLQVTLKHIPTPTGVPTIGAAAFERVSFGSVLATAGYASRFRVADAAVAALLELAQSRSTDLQGSREDCATSEKARLDEVPATHWMVRSDGDGVAMSDLDDACADISVVELAERVRASGAHDVAYVEFPRYDGLTTARVLAPGVETWHATHGHSGLGVRLRRLYGDGGGSGDGGYGGGTR